MAIVSLQAKGQSAGKVFYLIEGIDSVEIPAADSAVIDSCLRIYHASNDDSIQVHQVATLANLVSDERIWPKYNQLVIELAEAALKSGKPLNAERARFFKQILAFGITNVGYQADVEGDWKTAIDQFHLGLKLYRAIDHPGGEGSALTNLGTLYGNLGEDETSVRYYNEAMEAYEKIGDTLTIAIIHNNLGAFYRDEGRFEEAMQEYQKARTLIHDKGETGLEATILANIGATYAKMGKDDDALKFCGQSMSKNQSSAKNETWCNASVTMARIHLKRGALGRALDLALQSYQASTEKKYASIRSAAADLLHKIYRQKRNFKQSLNYHEISVSLKDSLSGMDIQKKAIKTELRARFHEEQLADSLAFASAQEIKDAHIKEQQAELQRGKIEKYALLGGIIFLITIAIISAFAIRKLQTAKNKIASQKKLVEEEKQKSDELLLNILPESTAAELKEKGFASPQPYEAVTVLFVDIAGFTRIAEQMSAAELVQEIDHCFRSFDNIINRYPIEKIKTIGDAYMCAAGLPIANDTHATDMVSAAIEIRDYMNNYQRLRKSEGKPYFSIRLGIHTGPVVAGVVGTQKFAYDLWGDTVNLAARMESSGEVGRINISRTTFESVKGKFDCNFRGNIDAKNKGQVEMYFAEPIARKTMG